ncbi:hypothetical protein CPLU01_07732 [Colletotrichum plurivorum]|uniref:Uncharacterized protein n=1 Tax=Colletotrichum plurivorum TaxID=2175906 RepID=A0A8H6NDX9_9PEZI|nr:hypothetical protein CPLU01_07732 [Colletotrichum plurivorum]
MKPVPIDQPLSPDPDLKAPLAPAPPPTFLAYHQTLETELETDFNPFPLILASSRIAALDEDSKLLTALLLEEDSWLSKVDVWIHFYNNGRRRALGERPGREGYVTGWTWVVGGRRRVAQINLSGLFNGRETDSRVGRESMADNFPPGMEGLPSST